MWNYISKYLKKYKTSIIYTKNSSYSYEEFYKICYEQGKRMKAFSKKSKKCLILCNNNFNTAVAIFSCWYANLIPMPLTYNYGNELWKNIIKTSSPDILVTDCDLDFDFECVYNIQNSTLSGSLMSSHVEEELNDVAVIMHTSGTSGTSKGVMLTHNAVISNVESILEYMYFEGKQKILVSRPLYHISVLTGELLVSMCRGMDIYLSETNYNPFQVAKLLEKERITVLGGTPTMLYQVAICLPKSYTNIIYKLS